MSAVSVVGADGRCADDGVSGVDGAADVCVAVEDVVAEGAAADDGVIVRQLMRHYCDTRRRHCDWKRPTVWLTSSAWPHRSQHVADTRVGVVLGWMLAFCE